MWGRTIDRMSVEIIYAYVLGMNTEAHRKFQSEHLEEMMAGKRVFSKCTYTVNTRPDRENPNPPKELGPGNPIIDHFRHLLAFSWEKKTAGYEWILH